MQGKLWKRLVSGASQAGQNSHVEHKCLHSAFLQGEWEYGALSYQLVLSSSCNVMAGRAKARQDLGCSHSAQVVRNVMLVAW